MADFRKEMLAMENENSKTYGFATPRDRHLENPRLWEYMNHPAIVERAAQLLGPDLLCWRTQLFYKGPGSPGDSVPPGQHVHGRRLSRPRDLSTPA